MKTSRFLPGSVSRLYHTLEYRVNAYFDKHGLNRYATPAAVGKTVLFTVLFGACYAAILLTALPLGVFWLLWFLMGAFLMRAAMSIVHDAARGVSFSPRPWVLAVLRRCAHLVDGTGFWDRRQPTAMPFSDARPTDADADMAQYVLVHVTPFATERGGVLYRHRYMRTLYPFYVLFWTLFRDFKYYQREKSRQFFTHHPAVHWVAAFVSKAYYVFYLLVVPAQALPLPFWQIALGFGCMHLGSGVVALFALLTDQPLDGPDIAVPNADGSLDYTWGQRPVLMTHHFGPGQTAAGQLTSSVHLDDLARNGGQTFTSPPWAAPPRKRPAPSQSH